MVNSDYSINHKLIIAVWEDFYDTKQNVKEPHGDVRGWSDLCPHREMLEIRHVVQSDSSPKYVSLNWVLMKL